MEEYNFLMKIPPLPPKCNDCAVKGLMVACLLFVTGHSNSTVSKLRLKQFSHIKIYLPFPNKDLISTDSILLRSFAVQIASEFALTLRYSNSAYLNLLT